MNMTGVSVSQAQHTGLSIRSHGFESRTARPINIMRKVAVVDMDNTLVDYTAGMRLEYDALCAPNEENYGGS